MYRLIFVLGLAFAAAQSSFGQINFPSSKATNSIVTILSDGLSEPNSTASQILSEISVALDKESDLRVLSINGYGGPVNIRDLLQLRGADLAVVNNDVLAYLDLAKALPDARRKVRLIAPLFHQHVFLLGRQNIRSLDDLRGRKIGVSSSHPSRGITARTIFGLSKINAEFIELDDKDLARRASSDLDAVLLYEKDLAGSKTLGVGPGSFHLLSIPAAGPLAQVYIGRKIGKVPLAGFNPAENFETVQVSTVLAAFDWNAKQGRYPDVVSFVQKFFALLPQMRAKNPASPFSRTDVKLQLPGWERFGPAEALVASAPVLPAQPDNLPASLSAGIETTEALRLMVIARPPLTNAQQADGGITLKLLTDALTDAGMQTSVQWVEGEKALLDGLLTSKTADAGLFWQTPNCDIPRDQSASEAALCDQAVISEPLMQVVIGVFTRLDMSLSRDNADAAEARVLCVPENQPIPNEALTSIPWTKAATVKLLRPKTLIDCLAALDRREADALVTIEPEARYVIEKLKLSQSLQISQRSAVTTGLHAVVAKENPRQAQLIQRINGALAKFRSSDRYAAVMASHIADLTGSTTKGP